MKKISTILSAQKLKFNLLFCFLFAISSISFGQTTATLDFENIAEHQQTSFTKSGINFTTTGSMIVYSQPPNSNFGANSSDGWLESPSNQDKSSQNAGGFQIATPATSFKINSFAAWTSNTIPSLVPRASGVMTFTGTKPDNTTVTATRTISPTADNGTGWHLNINFTGTDLENVQLIKLEFTLPSNLKYFSIDDINFTTAAVVTNQYSINDVSQNEGNSGSSNFGFTISRTQTTATGSVTVNTANVSATGGTDYTTITNQVVNFAIGESTKPLNVVVSGDATVEPNETFQVNLSSPTGGTIADGQGIGTIQDDDQVTETFEDDVDNTSIFTQNAINFITTGTLKVRASSPFGAGGSTKFLTTPVLGPFVNANTTGIQIDMTGKSFNIISIDLWISDSDINAPNNGTVTFTGTKADGTGTVTHTAALTLTGNAYQTVNFGTSPFNNIQLTAITFTLPSGISHLQVDNFSYGVANLTGTQLTVNDISVIEGSSGGTTAAVFTVSRTNNTSNFSVDVATSAGTATAGTDYVTLPTTTINFTNGGALTQTVTATVNHDNTPEPNETFNLNLSNPTNGALILDGLGIATINDDDGITETYEDETNAATTFSQNGASFTSTGHWRVRNATGSGNSSFFFDTGVGNGASSGNVGTITISTPNKAFKFVSFDGFTSNDDGFTNASGVVTVKGNLFGGGSVQTNKTITPTGNTGNDWVQNIGLATTPLDGQVLTSVEFIIVSGINYIGIDNFKFEIVDLLPEIHVTDASNNAIASGSTTTSTANNTDFGGACLTGGTVSKTYSVKNLATLGTLNLTAASLGGGGAAHYSITSQVASSVSPTSSTSLTILFDPSAVGTHTATITIPNNDADENPYTFTISGVGNAHPNATITANPNPVCQNGTLNLSAAAGATTYLWSGNGIVLANANSTTAIPTANGAQIYSLTATSSAGCTATATTSVTVNASPSATITAMPSAVCVNGTINLSAAAGATTYLWGGNGIVLANSNATTAVPTASGAQTYTLTVTGAGGCSATATTSVTVNALPVPAPSSNTPVCIGNTLNLSSTTATSYSWTGPNSFISTVQNPSVSNVSILAGSAPYTLTVTNASGCTASATTGVTISSLPIPNPSSDSPKCVGTTLSFNSVAGMSSYLWVGPNSFSSSIQAPSISNVTTAAGGTYTLTVTNSGCSASATTAVTINALATAIATPPTQTICSGGAITTIAITGTGTSYTWTRDNTTAVTGIAASGSGDISGSLTNATDAPITVTFTITPIGTCNGIPITATVVVNPIPTATASTPSQAICSGQNITGIIFSAPAPQVLSSPDPSSDIISTITAEPTQGIAFSSAVVGTVFNWTRDNVGTVGGTIPASGSGNISGNFTNTTASPITVTFTITPSYTNAGKACTGTPITVTVTVNPKPADPTITGGGVSVCQGSGVTLTAPADPNSTYAWQRALATGTGDVFTSYGGTTNTQVVTTSGLYRVVVTNQYNCSTTPSIPTTVTLSDFSYNGSLDVGDNTQNQRLFRDGTASTCAPPKAFPGVFTGGGAIGARYYDSYTITNPRNVPMCAVVGLTSVCGVSLYSATYLNSYDPNNLATNFLADHGSSFDNNLVRFYEVNIPANGTIVVVVNTVAANFVCSSYNLTVELPREAAGITVTPNNPICAAGSPTTLTASAANTYLWNPGGATTSFINVTPNTATTYSVTLGYGNGSCSATATTQITINPALTASSNSPICAGATLNLSTDAATSYAWTGPNSFSSSLQNPSISNITTAANGTYTVVLINGSCSTTATTSVTINPVPVPNPSSNSPRCVGNTLTFNSIAGMNTYAWNGPNGFSSSIQAPSISNITAAANGTYTLTVTNANGCTASATTAVIVNALPLPPTITLTTATSVCSPNTLNLTASGCAGTVTWSQGGSTGTSLNLTAVGTYSITATCTVNGCTSDAGSAVSGLEIKQTPAAPTIGLTTTSVVCSPSTINLTASGCAGTVTWSDNSTGNSLTISAVGTYSITAICTVNGCPSPASTAVSGLEIKAKPLPPTITLTTASSVCTPNTLNLTASGCAGMVTWSNAATGTSLTLSAVGTYSITATCTVNGCTSDASSAVSGLEIKQTPAAPTIGLTTGSVVCSPSTINLTASGCAGTVTWSDNSTGTSLTLSAVGTYSITATCTVNGCPSPASTAVSGLEIKAKPAPPTITLTTASSVCSPNTLTLTASGCAGMVTWSQGGATGTSLTLSTVGTYAITATCTVNGCVSDASSAISGLEIKQTPAAPSIGLTTASVVCSPSTINLTASGCAGRVTWSDNSTGNSLNISAVGTYSITAICTVNGCPSPVSSAVSGLEIKAKPTPPTITLTTASSVCSPSTINLTASGCTGTVTWSQGGATGASLTLSAVGTYAITATCTVNGCVSDASSAISGLEIKQTPLAPTIGLTTASVVCSPSTLNLTASGCAGTVTWSDNSTGNSLTLSAVGTYSITAICTVNGCPSPASSAVSGLEIKAKPSAPTITSPSQLSVCTPNTLNLTASGCAGTVTWSQGGATGTSLTLSTVGTYSITATCTVNGCVSDASSAVTGLEIKQTPSAPTIGLTTSAVVCSPSTLNLTASGCTGTVTWSDNSTGTSLTLSAVGTYSITAICTVNGCPSPASSAVSGLEIKAKPLAPTITPPSQLSVCFPSTLSLTTTCTTGTVLWSDNSTNPILTIAAVGTYSVSASCVLNGCTSDASATVTGLEIKAKPNAPVITPPNPLVVCSPATLSLNASGCAGTVTWSNGATGVSLLLNAVGTYALSATCTVNGCTSDASPVVTGLTINPTPIVNANLDQTICVGNTVSLSTTCNLYALSANLTGSQQVPPVVSSATGSLIGTFNPLTNQMSVNINYNGLAGNITGSHLHNGAAGTNGGVIVDFMGLGFPNTSSGNYINTIAFPPAQVANLLAGNIYTNLHNSTNPGGEIRGQITATCVANSYVWNPGNLVGQTVSVSPLTTTIYTVTASNTTTGCSATATTQVIVNPLPIISVSSNSPQCVGNTLNLNSSGGVSYSWTGANGFTSNAQNPSISSATVANSGLYIVTVTDGNGCSTTASTNVIINALPIPTATSNSPICNGGTLNLFATGGAQYSWTGPSGFASTLQNPNILNTNLSNAGTYNVTVTDANGCSATASTSVISSNLATATNTGPYITNQTITLLGSGGTTYSWAGPNGFTATGATVNIPNAILSMGGVYTATITSGLCNNTATTNVVVTGIDPCTQIVDYQYVQAGNPYQTLFALTNGMTIAQSAQPTSILVTNICPSVTIESFEMNIQGPNLNWNIIQNVPPNALFDNFGLDVFGRLLPAGNYTLTVTGYSKDNKLGVLTYGPVVTTFTIVGNMPTISFPTYTGTEFCAGNAFNVNFSTTGTFNGINQFDVLLSNELGDFTNAPIIGTSASAGTVACTIPLNVVEGQNYRIKVVSTNPTLSSINPSPMQIHPFLQNLVSTANDYSAGTTTKKAVNSISATNKVNSPAIVNYQSAGSIQLNAGFEAKAGSVFKAEIKTCPN